ncbi:MAG: hypothetical protein R3B47_19660 [Bacteroidia bacterium]
MTEGYPVGHFVGYVTDGIFQSQEEVFSHIGPNGEVLAEGGGGRPALCRRKRRRR